MCNKNLFKGKILLYLTMLLISLTACQGAVADNVTPVPFTPTTPAVVIQTTEELTSNFITNLPTQTMVGKNLRIVSTHTDNDGLTKVEFYVNGQLIDVEEFNYPTIQTTHEYDWVPEKEGLYQIMVKAYSENEKASSPSNIQFTIEVGPYVPPTSPPPLPTATSCLPSSLLREDVTPDGAELQAGQSFEKIWRIVNNGTCIWDTNYYLESTDKISFGASRLYLPHKVNANESIELALTMTAPLEAGEYRSNWRLFYVNQDGEAEAFGQIFYVDFKVLAQ